MIPSERKLLENESKRCTSDLEINQYEYDVSASKPNIIITTNEEIGEKKPSPKATLKVEGKPMKKVSSTYLNQSYNKKSDKLFA